MNSRVQETTGCALAIMMFGFGIVQLVAGWIGIADAFGSGWAIAAVIVAVLFRFTLPMVVGAFLCAKNVWEWHWMFAALFAAPGLLFMVPALFGSMIEAVRRR